MMSLDEFEQVARGELRPSSAALQLQARQETEREAHAKPVRPAWVPSWLWTAGVFAAAVLLALIGVNRQPQS